MNNTYSKKRLMIGLAGLAGLIGVIASFSTPDPTPQRSVLNPSQSQNNQPSAPSPINAPNLSVQDNAPVSAQTEIDADFVNTFPVQCRPLAAAGDLERLAACNDDHFEYLEFLRENMLN